MWNYLFPKTKNNLKIFGSYIFFKGIYCKGAYEVFPERPSEIKNQIIKRP